MTLFILRYVRSTLSGCALTSLSPLVAAPSLVRGVQMLNLAANALSAIPDAVYALPSLRSLSIEGNAISQERLNVSQYELLSALETFSADADAFQSSNCDGGGAVVYFASNPLFSVCDPAAYTSASSSSSSSSSASSASTSSSSGGSQRPALIAGSVAISCGLLVALVAKLLADRRKRQRLKEEEEEEQQQLRIRERVTESSHGALATMSPPSTPVAGRDDDDDRSNSRDGEWYHILHGDPADDALPSVKSLLERCRLAAWHRDPALVTLEKPMSEFLASEGDQVELRTSTTIVSSSNLRDLWLARYRDERVAVKRVILSGDRQGDAHRLREPALLATLAHPNVLRLRGVSYSSSLGLLVLYELMDRGDLRSYLRSCHADAARNSSSSDGDVDSARQTSWWGTRRLEIALDVARALLYLHSMQRVAHGALTSRAVLLNHEFAAKLAGFERFQPLPDYGAAPDDAGGAGDRAATPTSDPNEFASLAPELLTQRQVGASEATDVYAFGALLLELDAGFPPFRAAARRHGWSDQELRQRLASVADASALDKLMDVSPACPAALRILTASCLSHDPLERPTAAALVAVLKSVLAAATEQEDASVDVGRVKKKKKKRSAASSAGRSSFGRL